MSTENRVGPDQPVLKCTASNGEDRNVYAPPSVNPHPAGTVADAGFPLGTHPLRMNAPAPPTNAPLDAWNTWNDIRTWSLFASTEVSRSTGVSVFTHHTPAASFTNGGPAFRSVPVAGR